MPGPQIVARRLRCAARSAKSIPRVPIVWGGYFASLYTEAALNAPVRGFRGQGPGRRHASRTARANCAARATFRASAGSGVQGPVRPARPHRRAPAASRRTISLAAVSPPGPGEVHRAHVPGLAHRGASGQHRLPVPLQLLRRGPGLRPREDGVAGAHRGHSRRTCRRIRRSTRCSSTTTTFSCARTMRASWPSRIAPLQLRWWCEARVDIVLGYSDDTLRKLRAAGCVMIFFGVESGNGRGAARYEEAAHARSRPWNWRAAFASSASCPSTR